MDRAAYFHAWSGLHGGYDPSRNGFVRGWLTVAYVLGGVLARAHVSPHTLTALGVVGAGAAAAVAAPDDGWRLMAAALLVALAALFDGLDGAVAVLRDRVTRQGFLLDSVGDRVSDLFLILTLWRAGAGAWPCVYAGALLFLLEYVRARASLAGLADIGVATVGERPTRVVLTIAALLSAAAVGGDWPTWGAVAVAGVSAVGSGQLVRVAWSRLG